MLIMCSKPAAIFLAVCSSIGVAVTALTGCQKTDTVNKITIDTFFVKVPNVYADSSRTIQLPADTVRLNGSATDPGGQIAAWLWSEVTGPNVAVIQSAG